MNKYKQINHIQTLVQQNPPLWEPLRYGHTRTMDRLLVPVRNTHD